MALCHVFDAPGDKRIRDVVHQAFPRKILAGRPDRSCTRRQRGGLSGYSRSSKSPFKPFEASHSSTTTSPRSSTPRPGSMPPASWRRR